MRRTPRRLRHRSVGNWGGRSDDYLGVVCDDYRAALSAQLDGEDPGTEPTRLDEHLAGCAGCRHWLTDAVRVTRAVRLEPADVPDLTAAILARVRDQAPTGSTMPSPVVRAGLFAVAAGQAAAAIPSIVGLDAFGPLPVHSVHELGSFNLALAVAFGWTAWKPVRARAHLPLLATLVGVLVVLTAVDVALGRVSLGVEAGHLLIIAGLVLTGLLARGRTEPDTSPSGAGAAPDDDAGWREAA